jgi:hypothetical protein
VGLVDLEQPKRAVASIRKRIGDRLRRMTNLHEKPNGKKRF